MPYLCGTKTTINVIMMKLKPLFIAAALLLATAAFGQKSKVPVWLNLSAGGNIADCYDNGTYPFKYLGGEALLFRLLRQRADDVVGLVAFHAVDGDVEGLDESYYIRYRLAQVVGHLLAVGLVFAVFLLS